MKKLRHPNIVLLLGVFFSGVGNAKNIVMELCSASLSVFTKESSRNLDLTEVAYIMNGLHEGLAYLHDKDTIHRFDPWLKMHLKRTKNLLLSETSSLTIFY